MELHQQFGTLSENLLQHPAKIYKSKMTEEEVKVLPSASIQKQIEMSYFVVSFKIINETDYFTELSTTMTSFKHLLTNSILRSLED